MFGFYVNYPYASTQRFQRCSRRSLNIRYFGQSVLEVETTGREESEEGAAACKRQCRCSLNVPKKLLTSTVAAVAWACAVMLRCRCSCRPGRDKRAQTNPLRQHPPPTFPLSPTYSARTTRCPRARDPNTGHRLITFHNT